MIMYSLCLTAISLHLLLSRIDFSIPAPIEFLEDLAGPDSAAFPILTSTAAAAGVAGGVSSSSECIHEEGGRYAVYVSCGTDALEKIGGLYIGASYRVTSCR